MQNYQQLLKNIIAYGEPSTTRNLTSRYLFGEALSYNLQCFFPALKLRDFNLHSAIEESRWDLNGRGDLSKLEGGLAKVWKKFADENGKLPFTYGEQLRNFNGVDQMQQVVNKLKANPFDRNCVVHISNPAQTHGLPPCQTAMVYSSNGKYLDLQVQCRSQDAIWGLPTDIIRYAIFNMVVAAKTNLKPRHIQLAFTNVHIYEQDLELARYLAHAPSQINGTLFQLELTDDFDFNYRYEYTPVRNVEKRGAKLQIGDLSGYGL
jgi:thymidylate synthase